MSNISSHVGDMVCFRLLAAQITATQADEALYRVPFNAQVVKLVGFCAAIGGTTVMTDLDFVVENGTTDICAAIPVVDSSAIVTGATVVVDPTSGQETLSAGDILHLDSTVTGGNSPTADGAGVDVWCVRT